MQEKPKNREWVKNAAIIFLAVLLVLTFFSNTIMNRSLPEVATQYVTNGSIVARVRGTGTVVANGSHQVKADGTREIRSVLVKTGQEVHPGDVLFTLGAGSSADIEAAEEKLRSLQNSYNRTAVGIPSYSYATDERKLADAKTAMDEAKQALDIARKAMEQSADYNTQIKDAETQLDAAIVKRDAAYKVYQDELAQAKAALADAESRQMSESERAALEAELAELREKQASDDQIKALQKQIEQKQEQIAQEEKKIEDIDIDALNAELDKLKDERDRLAADIGYLSVLSADDIEALLKDMETEEDENRKELIRQLTEVLKQMKELNDKLELYKEVQKTIAALEKEIRALEDQIAAIEVDPEISKRIKEIEDKLANGTSSADVDAARAALDAVSREAYDSAVLEVEKWETVLETLLSTKSPASDAYKEAKAAYQVARDNYLTLKEALEEKKASNERGLQLDYIDLMDISQQIEAAKKKLAELTGGEENTVVANVSGIVESIEVTAGEMKNKDDILCTIEVPDMGYTMSFSVTRDQANRLRIGDTATVSNYYWGREIIATLSSIKTDPKNPQNNKLLTFDLDGDVTAGSDLTISVGQKSANYDVIIPSSAIRSDTNGSFVLKIEAKNSPLGNRYIARRVAVEVLASDDSNSAVTADLAYGDYVITTSSAPVKSGEQVRLATS
ncbi:MAG: HlyD family efflux transporter periplasmic adaptor subunit [Oscillospiraceae bacterium]|nr:HlyD family efflux transporter periplasmic adaptor subunit [Oscillospiraceae bacterium]